jgi:predicted membrane metal-binding protein
MTNQKRWAATLQILLVAISAMILGSFSASFSGSTAAWVGLLAFIFVLISNLFQLFYGLWRSDRRPD